MDLANASHASYPTLVSDVVALPALSPLLVHISIYLPFNPTCTREISVKETKKLRGRKKEKEKDKEKKKIQTNIFQAHRDHVCTLSTYTD